MAMFGHKAHSVEIGDRFVKAGDRSTKVWEVLRLWATPDGILHARLENLADTMAISVITLTDPQFFSPIQAVAPAA